LILHSFSRKGLDGGALRCIQQPPPPRADWQQQAPPPPPLARAPCRDAGRVVRRSERGAKIPDGDIDEDSAGENDGILLVRRLFVVFFFFVIEAIPRQTIGRISRQESAPAKEKDRDHRGRGRGPELRGPAALPTAGL
jgi:hypothetical protein